MKSYKFIWQMPRRKINKKFGSYLLAIAMLLTQNSNEPNKADGSGASTSPSTGTAGKGILAFAAIAPAGGAVMIAKKKEQD